LLVSDESEMFNHLERTALGEVMLEFYSEHREICEPLHGEFAFEPSGCCDYVHATGAAPANLQTIVLPS
jgi:hypothetical protein